MSAPVETSGAIIFVRLKSGGYRLLQQWRCYTGIIDWPCRIHDKNSRQILALDSQGWLTMEPGYHWDGSSGPVIDRRANMRAGLAHDGLYQCLRASRLPNHLRVLADQLYVDLYLTDGGYSLIAKLDYIGLRLGAGYAAMPQSEIDVITLSAP